MRKRNAGVERSGPERRSIRWRRSCGRRRQRRNARGEVRDPACLPGPPEGAVELKPGWPERQPRSPVHTAQSESIQSGGRLTQGLRAECGSGAQGLSAADRSEINPAEREPGPPADPRKADGPGGSGPGWPSDLPLGLLRTDDTGSASGVRPCGGRACPGLRSG